MSTISTSTTTEKYTSRNTHYRHLAEQALAGDDEAVQSILEHLRPAMKKVCGERLPEFLFEDGAQMCSIALWEEVLPAWARGGFAGGLVPLAFRVFHDVCSSLLQHTFAQCRDPNRTDADIAEVRVFAPASEDPLQRLLEAEAEELMMGKIMEAASPLAQKLIPLLRAGHSMAEAAQLVGVPRATASQAMHRLAQKLGLPSAVQVIEQVDLNGNVVAVHESIRAAGRATGFPAENIGAAVRGEISQTHGYRWRRARSRNAEPN